MRLLFSLKNKKSDSNIVSVKLTIKLSPTKHMKKLLIQTGRSYSRTCALLLRGFVSTVSKPEDHIREGKKKTRKIHRTTGERACCVRTSSPGPLAEPAPACAIVGHSRQPSRSARPARSSPYQRGCPTSRASRRP